MRAGNSKSEIRNPKQIQNSMLAQMWKFGFQIRVLALALAFFAHGAFCATNISAGDEDAAKLRPPRAEILPTFWERYNIWIIVGSLVFLALLGIIVWIVTRPKPPMVVPPEVRAKRALELLSSKPEDGLVLSQVSQILRRYIAEAFALPPGELTTTEFCRLIASHERVGPELATRISEFLRQCDERKFMPSPPNTPMTAIATAQKLVETAQARLAELRHRAEEVPAA
jgi:hypothetical protein